MTDAAPPPEPSTADAVEAQDYGTLAAHYDALRQQMDDLAEEASVVKAALTAEAVRRWRSEGARTVWKVGDHTIGLVAPGPAPTVVHPDQFVEWLLANGKEHLVDTAPRARTDALAGLNIKGTVDGPAVDGDTGERIPGVTIKPRTPYLNRRRA